MAPTLPSLSVTGFAIAALVIALIYRLSQIGSRDKRLPPGPPTIPILGNLHLVPKTGLGKKLKEWGETYGGVFSLKFGGGTVIILFDRKAVHHLLDKKGVIYSERPESYVPNLVTGGDSFAFMNSTPLWRAERKVAVHNLSPKMLEDKVGHIQDAESVVLLADILNNPDGYYNHIRRTTSSVASAVVWGHRGPTMKSFWAHAVYDAMDNYSAALEPSANPPVDEFPFLKWFPGTWTKRAIGSYKCMDDTWNEARRRVDARRAKGIKRDAIIDSILDGEKHSDLSNVTPKQMNHFLGVVVEGGADTTASATLTSMMYLALHPEFQDKARKQLDAVCGTSRLPAITDFEAIPYINCIIKEAMRIHPVLPLGVPHRVNQDDWFDGMLIPKDATVILPSWAMHLSETQGYKDPEAYNPDRFLDFPRMADSYAGSPDWQKRDHYGYGAGRRICPGIHLAERTQWRLNARLLWAFDILPKIDPQTGKPMPIDVNNYHEGIAHGPAEFPVVFKPRSQAHIDVIRREMADAEQFLKAWND
ncbi:cytochrome P450 [Exophiala viscosa]|uniref:Cytochrome P450 n=1 Tax=Exophiala viscosa TaxID=2486360 RepID=A0AAN6DWD9_9EURO|nr:cytochrome P450 [Exophiala viscosa]